MRHFSSKLAGALAFAALSVLPGCAGPEPEINCAEEAGPTCPAETLTESEPNNTRTDADTLAGATPSVAIRGNTKLTGTLTNAQDLDVYRMELKSAQVVRIETFHGGAGLCESGLDTGLVLQNGEGLQLAVDDDTGIGYCSALTLSLQAGTYYVQVVPVDLSSQQAYALEVTLQEGVGQEYEPNDTNSGATSLRGTESFISGTLSGPADVDVFRISLPERKSLRVEIIEDGTQKRCDSRDMDSTLELLDVTGNVLVADDDSGRGYCSRIDGIGARPLEPYGAAADLPAGTYYLRVKSSPTASGSAGTFDYRLSVTTR
jgi:hypothetical protein